MTQTHTAQEERNVARIHQWAKAWSQPGGSAATMVDECYADTVEVIGVLQGKSVVREGHDKARWRAVEMDIEQQYESRSITFHSIIARDDTAAVEATVHLLAKDGVRREWPFAVFFRFDDQGRIAVDHTYMPDSPHTDALTEGG